MEKAYLNGRGQRLEVRKDRGVHLVVPCAALRFDRLGKSRDGIDVLGFPVSNQWVDCYGDPGFGQRRANVR